ncbi:hypothetical protein [Tersicoccus sp. Bi-70]|uniref:hypothetical protein n=1 Tax=Tersicoccus sp. Bi-70 TaxID=1897634 RepID=UPI00097550FF|nr:hypothetical protein [Tersicoccus sp. Bi-70]OMH32555.1 hypothetical protein BGP79_07045 [Tersicoccus sp. Bi-70]
MVAAVDPDCVEYGCTHPHVSLDEWALMWMRGLEPREIARLCGVNSWRVDQAIAVRVRRDPTMPGRRLKRHLQPAPATLAQRQEFKQKLAEYRDWLQRHGREPREHGENRHERALYGWLSRQRAADRDATLELANAAALDAIGRWRRPALGHLKADHFDTRLEQFRRYVAAAGRLPTRRPGASEDERALAVWLQGLRAGDRAIWLTPEREAALTTVHPGWRGSSRP